VKLAVAAGINPATGGNVTIEAAPGQESYKGSEQNGIKSSEYGKYDRSFKFKK
jgi:LCCL domain